MQNIDNVRRGRVTDQIQVEGVTKHRHYANNTEDIVARVSVETTWNVRADSEAYDEYVDEEEWYADDSTEQSLDSESRRQSVFASGTSGVKMGTLINQVSGLAACREWLCNLSAVWCLVGWLQACSQC